MLRSATLRGAYGVPLVAYDGTAGGLTRDGKLLVLETGPGNARTRFVVLDAATLKLRQSFSFPGTWAYDALSPEGNTLYLTQILSSTSTFRYLVRAYDLQLHQLVKGAIADKSEPGAMTGLPVSRVASADGTWAYTLYQRLNGGKPFIHALNTRARVAICIDLDWRGNPNNMGDVRLTLSADGQQLVVRRFSDGKAMLTVAAPSSLGDDVLRARPPPRSSARRSRLHDLDDVAVRVEDPQLTVGARAPGEDLADALELALAAELAGVRLDVRACGGRAARPARGSAGRWRGP